MAGKGTRKFETSHVGGATGRTPPIPRSALEKDPRPGPLFEGKQEYTEDLYKKELHDPDYHDGVITHLEPDILECEVKWALGSITTNKASGGDGIPVELFQILKDDALKVLHSIWHGTGRVEDSPENVMN